jgi:hypothetical protein
MMQNANLRSVLLSKLSSKCKSKKEMSFFLVNDCYAYIIALPANNINLFKQIMRSSKEVSLPSPIQISIIIHTHLIMCSSNQGFTVEDILEVLRVIQKQLKYLPYERD